jgi:HEAT repeat protein
MPVPMPPDLDAHPRELVLGARAVLGDDVLIDWCADLLSGRIGSRQACTDPALPSLTWIGGRAVAPGTDWSPAEPPNDYWVRVWAARAFQYVWRDDVVDALVVGAADPAWRVRENVARVVAARELGAVVPYLLPMLDHDLPRVRATAVRAVGAAGEAEHAAAVADLRDDEDVTVRAAVERALERMSRRLDRPLGDQA